MFTILFISSSAFADTTVHLDIETSSGSLYNQNITVAPCDSDNAGTIGTTAYCALNQTGLNVDWSWYGTDAFLNSVEGKINNDNNNGVYWGWFANLNFGQTALNKYELNEGDSILINYDINPLKIEADNLTPSVGSNVLFTVTSFGYDASWNPAWNPVSSGKIIIGSDTFDLDSDGKYSFLASSQDSISAYATASSFINSPSINISPVVVASGGGGGGTIPVGKTFSVDQAAAYLISKQKPDGSFGDMLYTDWAAIGLASYSNIDQQVKQKISDYLKTNILSSDVTTDNERHAIALMSLGINPYSGTSKDYIAKIVSSFDGNQFGDNSLINDDIFALIVLKNAGYSSSDDIIKKDITYVLSNQASDGSFGGVDMTAASVQALRNFSDLPSASNSLSLAENYLLGVQATDGGFGNSFSTSWVTQALAGDSQMATQLNKADTYLASLQQLDGGVDSASSPEVNRIWATAYALPATLHISWNNIMQTFTKPVISSGGNSQTVDIVVPSITSPEVKQDIVKQQVEEKVDTNLSENEVNPKKEEDKKIKKLKLKVKKPQEQVKGSSFKPNLLEANALSAVSVNSEINESFMHKVAHKITSPFRWLLGKLGF